MRDGEARFKREEVEQFDWATFEELCQNQCSRAEISAVMGMSCRDIDSYTRDSVGLSFEEVQKTLMLCGKANIRKYQMNLAKHNSSMAIFMGKVYLSQSDGPETSAQVQGILDNIRSINVVTGRAKPVSEAA